MNIYSEFFSINLYSSVNKSKSDLEYVMVTSNISDKNFGIELSKVIQYSIPELNFTNLKKK